MVDVEITTDGEYGSANQDSNYSLDEHHPSADASLWSAGCQSFCTLNDGNQYKIKYVKFRLLKANSPTGNAYAKLYAHQGVFGTSSKPNGAALATSDALDVSTLGAAMADVSITFSGAQQVTLATNTYYCITFENPADGTGTIDATNHVHIGVDISTPLHEGNAARYRNSAWTTQSGHDLATFGVYGELVVAGGLSVPVAMHHLKSMNNAHVTDFLGAKMRNVILKTVNGSYR